MSTVESLMTRLQSEIDASKGRMEKARTETVQKGKERDARLAQFAQVCERLRGIWKPRIEAFAAKFGEKVQVKPTVTPAQRDVRMTFVSDLASVNLRLTACTDVDVKNLVMDYQLDIIPILMDYEKSSKAEFPLDKVDDAAVGKWIDDRLVAFVRTYLSMHENEWYLKATMVDDPIAKVRFPKHAAAGSLERGGKTIYFVSPETMKTFEQQNPEAKAPAKPTKK
jgi:YHS domain-containing protein